MRLQPDLPNRRACIALLRRYTFNIIHYLHLSLATFSESYEPALTSERQRAEIFFRDRACPPRPYSRIERSGLWGGRCYRVVCEPLWSDGRDPLGLRVSEGGDLRERG